MVNRARSVPDVLGKTVLITGASSGIGLATAKTVARAGANIVMVGRHPERSRRALDEVRRASPLGEAHLITADLSLQSEVRRVAAEFLDRSHDLHVLINNAGALFTRRSLTSDGIEMTFATNHLNYFLLTHLLLDALKRSAPSRIINVSSRAHERSTMGFDDLQSERGYSPMRVYGQSKLANVLFTYELARRLEGTGVSANCLHPGVVRTGFGKRDAGVVGGAIAAAMRVAGLFFIGPEKGAETTIYLASSPALDGVSGRYFARSRECPSNPLSRDEGVAARLWEVSERMCGLSSTALPASPG